MSEYDELNKKLADFVDMKHDWDNEICGYKTTESFCRNCWRATDYIPFPCIPNFTHSLSACFEWLVPKLNTPVITLRNRGAEWYCYIKIGCPPWEAEEYGETLALALCFAVERLLDEEVNDESKSAK